MSKHGISSVIFVQGATDRLRQMRHRITVVSDGQRELDWRMRLSILRHE